MFDALFLRHPRSVGESYVEHWIAAFGFAGRLSIAALACFVHALVPALFQRTGSRIVADLHLRMVANRRRETLGASAFDYAI
jgi:hypothetical protein